MGTELSRLATSSSGRGPEPRALLLSYSQIGLVSWDCTNALTPPKGVPYCSATTSCRCLRLADWNRTSGLVVPDHALLLLSYSQIFAADTGIEPGLDGTRCSRAVGDPVRLLPANSKRSTSAFCGRGGGN